MRTLKIGAKYVHYKNHPVRVTALALHSETLEELVIYEKLEDVGGFKKGSVWARPKKMFLEDVLIDGKKVPRFKFVKE